MHPSQVFQSVQPKSFGQKGKEIVSPRDGASRSFMNSVSKSGSFELPTASPISSKEQSSFDLQTITAATTAVPIVVIDSTGLESACSPNCFLYPIGSTLYTTFIPLISSQSAPSNEEGDEGDQIKGGELENVGNPGDITYMQNGNSTPEKQESRKMRQRTTFTRNVKHRILSLYQLYRMNGSKLSIRSIAYKIYSQLSKESFVR